MLTEPKKTDNLVILGQFFVILVILILIIVITATSVKAQEASSTEPKPYVPPTYTKTYLTTNEKVNQLNRLVSEYAQKLDSCRVGNSAFSSREFTSIRDN